MSRSVRHLARTLLLAALGCSAWSGQARADFDFLGIIVDDTVLMPVEDPKAEYGFYLSQAPMTAVQPNDGIVFHDIPGYSGVSFFDYISSSLFTITASAGSGSGLTDITLRYTPTNPNLFITNTGTTKLPLGRLVIETTFDYDPTNIPPPLLVPISYTSRTHTLSGVANVGSGITGTPRIGVVPEPSSLALGAMGLSLAALLARRPGGRSRPISPGNVAR